MDFRMVGNIQDKMAEGINHSHVVVVCITKKYIEKVAQTADATDNCKLEVRRSRSRADRIFFPHEPETGH
jgi:hypothetical protein